MNPNSEQADRSGGNADALGEQIYQAILGYTGARTLGASQGRARSAAKGVLELLSQELNKARLSEVLGAITKGLTWEDKYEGTHYELTKRAAELRAKIAGIEHNTPDPEATPGTSSLPNLPPVDSITLDTLVSELSLYHERRCEDARIMDFPCICGALEDTKKLIELWHTKELLALLPKRKVVVNRGYDGNDLESACNYYHLAFESWAEVIRYEDGYNQAIDETYVSIQAREEQ